jgi:Xaa-Pro aminopeptidase
MPSRSIASVAARLARLARVRDDLRAAQAGAVAITNLINLRYLSGFAGTAGAAVVTPERCHLLVDFRYVAAAREAVADGPVELEIVEGSFDDALIALLRRSGAGRIAIEAASMTVARFNRLAKALEPAAVLVPTDRLIERRRAVKDGVEIATLREAARRLSGVARQVRSFLREGRAEREIAADVDAAIREVGFERPAFDTIVASGENGARPHARPGTRTIRPGDGVVLDFGGVYDGYCVDLTRTLQIGVPGAEFRRIARAVEEAHAAAIAAVRPGARPSEIDAAARETLARHGLAEAFGHGTGHGLGLEVHEEPRISKLPGALPDEPVVPGMVFTVEPGAYVDGLGGVRIEDDVLVVDGGCEVLTDVPIDL